MGIWRGFLLVWPVQSQAPIGSSDIPEDIRNDFDEARDIVARSPRAAAALLRLCITKLCDELDAKGKDLDAKIADLVRKGLQEDVQKALDAVRVIGNDAVHAGEIIESDDTETAMVLFKLINMVVERMITEPKEIDKIYEILPEKKRLRIKERDRGNPDK